MKKKTPKFFISLYELQSTAQYENKHFRFSYSITIENLEAFFLAFSLSPNPKIFSCDTT